MITPLPVGMDQGAVAPTHSNQGIPARGDLDHLAKARARRPPIGRSGTLAAEKPSVLRSVQGEGVLRGGAPSRLTAKRRPWVANHRWRWVDPDADIGRPTRVRPPTKNDLVPATCLEATHFRYGQVTPIRSPALHYGSSRKIKTSGRGRMGGRYANVNNGRCIRIG